MYPLNIAVTECTKNAENEGNITDISAIEK
jgi:hypothetical protein